jgi:hypothetical protein
MLSLLLFVFGYDTIWGQKYFWIILWYKPSRYFTRIKLLYLYLKLIPFIRSHIETCRETIYCRYIFCHYAYLLYSMSNTKSVWYAFIAISTHNWIRLRKTNLPILSVWLISMIGRNELFCFLIALLVYYWPSVVFFLKIFPIWLPLMSFFVIDHAYRCV